LAGLTFGAAGAQQLHLLMEKAQKDYDIYVMLLIEEKQRELKKEQQKQGL